MKKAIVILGNYSPNPSSVANSMAPIIEKLTERYSIDIVTDRKSRKVPNIEKNSDINIFRVNNNKLMNASYFKELNTKDYSFFLKVLINIITFITKIIYYLRYSIITKEKNTAGWGKREILEKVLELDQKNNYELIVSASLPYKSHYIAEKIKDIKKEKIDWIVFEFDPYTFNDTLENGPILKKILFKDENRVFKKSDITFLTPELYDYYQKNKLFYLPSKVFPLPFANVDEIKINETDKKRFFLDKDKINCLFTGRLYDDIRTPKILLDLFEKTDKKIQLNMMTNYTANQINKYTSNDYMPNVIPFQDRETARYNMKKANILVNIGNTVEHQVPGKIFEYMSLGKPIIHFSKIKNDPALRYFSKYPSVLIINEWDYNMIDYKEKIEKFCMKYCNYELTIEQVNGYLAEYSSSAVKERLFSIMDELLGEEQKNE